MNRRMLILVAGLVLVLGGCGLRTRALPGDRAAATQAAPAATDRADVSAMPGSPDPSSAALPPLVPGPWALTGRAVRDADGAVSLGDVAAAEQALSVSRVGGRRFRCEVEFRSDTPGTPVMLAVGYEDGDTPREAVAFEYVQTLSAWTHYTECLVLPETAARVTRLAVRRGPGAGSVSFRRLALTSEPLRFDAIVRHYTPDGSARAQLAGPTRPPAPQTAELIYPTGRGAIAADLFLPLVLGCRSALPRGTRAEVVVDVPAAVTDVTLICGGHPRQYVVVGATAPSESITLDGARWRRYRAPTDLYRSLTDAQVLVFVRSGLPPGRRTRLGYHLEWPGGAQATRWLDLDVIEIPPGRTPQRFRFAMNPVLPWEIPQSPGFVELLQRVGVGAVEVDDIVNASEWRRATFEHLRGKGMKAIGLFSPVFWYPYATALRRDPDLQAKGIDGKTVPGGEGIAACPSYRGPLYQEQLALLRLWVNAFRIDTFDVDEECFGPGSRICFCARCRQRFAAYLARQHPALPPVSLEEIVRAPDRHEETARAWAQFKADLVTEWYRDYRRAIVEEWRTLDPHRAVILNATCQTMATGAGSGFGTPEFMSIMRDNAARLNSGTVQHLLPMPYCYQESYGGSLRRVGADLAQLRDLWQPQAPGRKPLFPYILAGGAGMCHLYPQRGLKYQLYEMVVTGGVAGGVFWKMNGMDGFHWKYLAEALHAIAAVEDVLWEGEPRVLPCSPAGAAARAVRRGEDAVIMVSDYGDAPVDVTVGFRTGRRGKVRDVETNAVVASLGPGQESFRVRLDGERVRLLEVGGR